MLPVDRWLYYEYEQLDSTQTEAIRLVSNGTAVHGGVVIAKLQTTGYGRYNRIWEMSYGDFATTIILRIPNNDVRNSELSQIAYVVGVSLLHTIAHMVPKVQNLKVKWVNDIYIDSGKVAGILLQKIPENFLLLGVGVNFVQHDIQNVKTSYLKKYAPHITIEQFLEHFLTQLQYDYNEWITHCFTATRKKWMRYSLYNVGDEILVQHGKDRINGKFHGIADDGALLLVTNNDDALCQNTCTTIVHNAKCGIKNGIKKIYAGEIFELSTQQTQLR